MTSFLFEKDSLKGNWMAKTKKLSLIQAKRRIQKIESRAQYFFFTTLTGLENITNHSAPVLFQKKRSHYYGIQILTTKYPVALNLVYNGTNGSGFLKKAQSIIYAIEFSWGIPEIRPWFITNFNLLKGNRFALSRVRSTFWEKVQRKNFIHPRGIKQLLQDLDTNIHIHNHASIVIKTVEPLKPNGMTFVCSHKPKIIEEDRPNLSLSFEFIVKKQERIGPEISPAVWNETVIRSCDLLLAVRERCEAYRTLYF